MNNLMKEKKKKKFPKIWRIKEKDLQSVYF